MEKNANKLATPQKEVTYLLLLAFLLLGMFSELHAQETSQVIDYTSYNGSVVDNITNDKLPLVSITVMGTNITTMTNSEGQFLLKVPNSYLDKEVEFSLIGYSKNRISLSLLAKNKAKIILNQKVNELSEINIKRPKDAATLVEIVFSKKGENYSKDAANMTAFYRETIKKRNKNVSLAEAVVTIDKKPYTITHKDLVGLFKARKSTNYSKLDTLALKLQGGPLNALYIDFMKYPEYFLTKKSMPYYDFTFDEPTVVNDKLIYVINFKQKPGIEDPMYFGKLYINSETFALTNAEYGLNVENRNKASELFVRRKPTSANVYPTLANYRIDYREKDGKWYYGYSQVNLEFVVNWNRKLFNSKYKISSEMLVTDWVKQEFNTPVSRKQNYKSTTILADEASGFADPDFWGAYNVIEPEKSIETAISKIQRQLKRIN